MVFDNVNFKIVQVNRLFFNDGFLVYFMIRFLNIVLILDFVNK